MLLKQQEALRSESEAAAASATTGSGQVGNCRASAASSWAPSLCTLLPRPAVREWSVSFHCWVEVCSKHANSTL